MAKRIVVNAGVIETRVALQENNLLTALYVERHRRRSIVGNVCKGIVTNVLPGMQAAFVDIGLSKDAFLYGGDYTANVGEYERLMLAGADEDPADLDVDDVAPKRESAPPIASIPQPPRGGCPTRRRSAEAPRRQSRAAGARPPPRRPRLPPLR